jgi:imidazole glycerol phosphate synthase subunit HisF
MHRAVAMLAAAKTESPCTHDRPLDVSLWHNTLAKLELAVTRAQDLGCGEILLTSVERESTWIGYDLETVKKISDLVELPVIAHGGAGSRSDVKQVMAAGASAAAGRASAAPALPSLRPVNEGAL